MLVSPLHCMTVSKGKSCCVGHLNTQFNLRTEWKKSASCFAECLSLCMQNTTCIWQPFH